MAVRPIVTVGNPVLRQKAVKVTHFGESLAALVDDMFDSLHAARGVGLAAPQVGVPQRLFIVEIPPEVDEDGNETAPSESYILVNPEIIRATGEEEMEEGCLSVPGYRGLVKRATSITIKGQDVHGRAVRYRGEDLLAQAFQHENDHLNGALYLDRIEGVDKLWRIPEGQEED